MSDYILELERQKRHKLFVATADTIDAFPEDATQWQIYVALHPRISFDLFALITAPLFYCSPEEYRELMDKWPS